MHRLRPRPCVAAAVALTGLVAVSAAADARVALTPVLVGRAPGFNVGLGFFLQGRWLSARRGVLSQPIFRGGLRGCGWPTKTLAWQVRPGTRVRVAEGTWTGAVAAADVVSGSVSARVGG